VQGHALLVGVGGSGKQSLAKLAAFVAGCDVFEIARTRKYDEIAFRDDLKALLNLVGVDNKKVLGPPPPPLSSPKQPISVH
jgi:dynein heavy chain, axonemal